MIGPFQGEHRWLSNFYPAEIMLGEGIRLEYETILYPTVEHAYQAAKTLKFDVRHYISRLKSPGEAKRRIRHVQLRPDWEDIKLDVMLDCLRSKFQIPHLRDKLKDTWGQELIEINHWNDTFWGVCNGKGQNHLGHLLMLVRIEIMRGGLSK